MSETDRLAITLAVVTALMCSAALFLLVLVLG